MYTKLLCVLVRALGDMQSKFVIRTVELVYLFRSCVHINHAIKRENAIFVSVGNK